MNWLRALGLFGAMFAVLGLAACGGDDDDDDDSGDSGGGGATAANLKVTTDPKLGAILTSSDGLTLYTFNQDTAGKSTCNADCAATWPPLTTSSADAPKVDGATGDFSVITRDDGAKQIAFNGKPLYRFAADKKAGDTTGEGVGGVWFAARASGAPANSGSGSGSTGTDYNY